ncbi:MAG TPA: hypothetical protein VFX49_14075 [Chloroflexota bacterium]|nr:hypothetical protein [Chloroflexota bacterium]
MVVVTLAETPAPAPALAPALPPGALRTWRAGLLLIVAAATTLLLFSVGITLLVREAVLPRAAVVSGSFAARGSADYAAQTDRRVAPVRGAVSGSPQG